MLATEMDEAVALVRGTLSIWGSTSEDTCRAFLRPLRRLSLEDLKRGLLQVSSQKKTRPTPADVLEAVGGAPREEEELRCGHVDENGQRCARRWTVEADGIGRRCAVHAGVSETLCSGTWDGVPCTRYAVRNGRCAMHAHGIG